MAIRLPRITHARQILRWFSLAENHIHKGYFAVYVGEGEKKRFAVPVSFLRQSSFQELMNQAEEGFGFDHPMGALTIPCSEAVFIDLTSYLGRF